MAEAESIASPETPRQVLGAPRQREAAALAAQGLTYQEIGKELGISKHTARAHIIAMAKRLSGDGKSPKSVVRKWNGGPIPETKTPPAPPVAVMEPHVRSDLARRISSPKWDSGMAVRCPVPGPLNKVPHIYAIRRADIGEVKIGVSRDPVRRLWDLQVAHGAPLELVLCVVGAEAGEKALHAQFGADRLLGEWFRESPAITAWIAENAP